MKTLPEKEINPKEYEKSDTALKDKMHRFLSDNKISYEIMIRAVNFWQDMTAEERGRMNEAYRNGEFSGHGWY